MNRVVKVAFRLEPDEDGYPPIAVEMLVATQLAEGQFRIENAPFFVSDIAFGDVVTATASDVIGRFMFDELVAESDYTSISIILLSREMDVYLMDFFRGHNCVIEFGEFGSFRMLAVAVPPSEDYRLIRRQLEILEGDEKLSFAELAVSGARSLDSRLS